MRLRRRGFLAGTAALATLPLVGRAGTARELRAAAHDVQLAPEGYPATRVWSYGGSVPGPTLRALRGGEIDVELVNALDEPTSIHWHGIRVPNAMDGVPGLTQDPVAPGERFRYRFAVPDAGTYWYHTHFNSVEQLSRGLAGALVVDEDAAPEVDRDEVLVISDWRMEEGARIAGGFDAMHDVSHAGRYGNYVTVNGVPELGLVAKRHERLRLRLVNAATARIFRIGLKGLEGHVVALDGMPLETPEPAGELTLAPAQRADLVVDVTAEAGEFAYLADIRRDGAYALATVEVQGDAGARRDPAGALPPNPGQPPLALETARRAPLEMTGGAMRWLASARWNGAEMTGEALAREGMFWAFNGVAGPPEEPLVTAALGETVTIPIANETAFPHAMHLHGHHFREVGAGASGPWRDTLLVLPGERREIAFRADNPGDWLFHCHMLGHQSAGMISRVRVTA